MTSEKIIDCGHLLASRSSSTLATYLLIDGKNLLLPHTKCKLEQIQILIDNVDGLKATMTYILSLGTPSTREGEF